MISRRLSSCAVRCDQIHLLPYVGHWVTRVQNLIQLDKGLEFLRSETGAIVFYNLLRQSIGGKQSPLVPNSPLPSGVRKGVQCLLNIRSMSKARLGHQTNLQSRALVFTILCYLSEFPLTQLFSFLKVQWLWSPKGHSLALWLIISLFVKHFQIFVYLIWIAFHDILVDLG